MKNLRLGAWTRVLAMLVVVLLGATACGSDAGGGEATKDGDSDTGSASGTASDDEGDDGGEVSDESIDVTLGSTNAQSSAFALFTAHARLAGDVDGNMNINVRETAASSENIQLVDDGDVELAISSWELLKQAHDGIGSFEGDPHENLVPILTYLQVAEFMLARTETVPENPTMSDLSGLTVAPSSQGASTYEKWANILDVLEIDYDAFDGSLEDVINAIKDGRIAAFGKSANGLRPDASMLDVASSTDVVPVTLTDEDVATLTEAVPYYGFTTIEAGAMDGWPEFQTPLITAVYFVDASMSDDEAYRLTKALAESLQAAADESGYGGADNIPMSLTVDTIEELPLHPGAERYFEEIGEL